jgi:uncharacterized membrane protein
MVIATIRFYDVVLFVHIIGVVAAFGVVFSYPLLLAAARGGGSGALHAGLARVWQRVVTPAGTIVLLAGIYLASDGPYDMSEAWIGISLVILIVLLGMAGAFFIPRERQLAQGDGDAAAIERQLRTGATVAAALVLVAVFLMATKP